MNSTKTLLRLIAVWMLLISISAGSVCQAGGISAECSKNVQTANLPAKCECPPNSECCGSGCCATSESSEQSQDIPTLPEGRAQREIALLPTNRLTNVGEAVESHIEGPFVSAFFFAASLQAKHIRIQV